LEKYNRKKPNKKFQSNKQIYLQNQNIDDCAKFCSEELGFDCLSFDFCYITGDCRLSDSSLSETEDYITANDCDIYESI
jgi:hypothetical protein